MFLKAKNVAGENTLIAVAKISAVVASEAGTVFAMENGDVHDTTLGFQAVGNRLAELGIEVA